MGLAAAAQGRYALFHKAMFMAGRPDKTTIEAAARAAGVDLAQAQAAMAQNGHGVIVLMHRAECGDDLITRLRAALLFEIGDHEHSGVDLPDVTITSEFLGGHERKSDIDLAGLTEPEAMRQIRSSNSANFAM